MSSAATPPPSGGGGRSNDPEHRSGAATKPRLWQRLSVRLGLIVVLAVILTSGFSFFTALDVRRHEVAAVMDETLNLSRAAALFQDDAIQQTRAVLFSLGSFPAVRAADWKACDEVLAGELRGHPALTNLGLAGPDGTVLCSAVPMSARTNISHRLYFVRTMALKSFSVGEYQIGRITA